MTRSTGLTLAGLLLAGLAGCGYDQGSLFRTDIKTVHVAMFETREFRRDLEFLLTEAVKKKIGSETPYRLAPERDADTILKGELLEVRQAAFAPDFLSRLPRDYQLTMIVRLQWKDLRSGQILVDEPLRLQSVDYLPPAGESEQYALQKVIERLASRIVARLYDEW